MTENKRFELVPMSNRGDIWYGVFDNFENEYVTAWGSIEKVCEKLNEIAAENEQLKKQLNAFKPIIFEDVNNGRSSILYEKVEE